MQRFDISQARPLFIRASQGHSMEGINPDLEHLSGADVPFAVHGTYYDAWEAIKETGLSKMERAHIHLAQDVPGSSGVISGMRASCEVLVWVDISWAEAAGMRFYRSKNGVILTEGINGTISTQFFK